MASEPASGASRRAQQDRKLPLAVHRPLEMGLGAVLAIVPLIGATTGAVQMPTIGVILAILMGAILMTLGLAGRREGEGVSIGAHRMADRVVVAVLIVAGILFIFTGALASGLFLALIGLAHGVLSLGTRYTYEETEIRRHSKPDAPPAERGDAGRGQSDRDDSGRDAPEGAGKTAS
jgi:hypothetical protein